jgi:hypothetical protein
MLQSNSSNNWQKLYIYSTAILHFVLGELATVTKVANRGVTYFLQNVASIQVMLMIKYALTFHTAWFYSNISVTKTKLSIVIVPEYENSSVF